MKILIAYATRYGTTEKCANILGDILKEKGHEVELVDLKKNIKVKPENYDVAVTGGSFFMGRMNGLVRKFIKRNLKTFLNMKTGIFVCGSDEKWQEETMKNFRGEFLEKTVKGYFGFEMVWGKMSPFLKNSMQQAYNTTESISKIKPENIQEFAEEIVKI